jgi:acid phosphatase family membrane protein YuiD
VNSVRAKRLAFDLIGYGGLPSTHTSIVTCATVLVGMREGIDHPAFLVALTFSFIVILDAASLRRQVGKHATYINELFAERSKMSNLRERIGHSKLEIGFGIVVGICCAYVLNIISNV